MKKFVTILAMSSFLLQLSWAGDQPPTKPQPKDQVFAPGQAEALQAETRRQDARFDRGPSKAVRDALPKDVQLNRFQLDHILAQIAMVKRVPSLFGQISEALNIRYGIEPKALKKLCELPPEQLEEPRPRVKSPEPATVHVDKNSDCCAGHDPIVEGEGFHQPHLPGTPGDN